MQSHKSALLGYIIGFLVLYLNCSSIVIYSYASHILGFVTLEYINHLIANENEALFSIDSFNMQSGIATVKENDRNAQANVSSDSKKTFAGTSDGMDDVESNEYGFCGMKDFNLGSALGTLS